MRFQTKIIVGYTILVLALALFFGTMFYMSSLRRSEEQEKSSLKVVSEQLVTQLDEKVGQMEASMDYLLSDAKILDSLIVLGQEYDMDEAYRAEAKLAIQTGINTDYITTHCYRMIFFNRNGDFFPTYSTLSKRAINADDFEIQKLWYLKEAEGRQGKPKLINAHMDTWGFQERPEVFSLLKELQGHNMGYIEVQNRVSDLENLLVASDDMDYLVVLNENEQLYSSNDTVEVSAYQDILDRKGELAVKSDVHDKLIAKSLSSKYDITVLAMEDQAVLYDNNAYNLGLTFLIALVFFLASMMFVILLSHYLTKPLRQIRTIMENTQLDNLGEDFSVAAPNDEIRALADSYQSVTGRLKESVVKEKRLSILHLQAQFDSLQAQVNPHFMYNVLNIIAGRGMVDGDDAICEMCGSLASMLRYSTNNENRYATIAEELDYLDQYFYLLKARYEHKIDFAIAVDESVRKQIIPKMALQQIVENCVNHGFENAVAQMRITITGWQENGYWYIRVHDNGQGFDQESLDRLQKKMEAVRKTIFEDRNNVEMGIGGMGLINTYARCLLLYSDTLVFDLSNGADGADVTVGAALESGDEEK